MIFKQNNMTAKEKAQELVNKMYDEMFYYKDGYSSGDAIGAAKQCALIAVDEILDIDCFDMSEEHFDNHIEYWEQVKQEIINL